MVLQRFVRALVVAGTFLPVPIAYSDEYAIQFDCWGSAPKCKHKAGGGTSIGSSHLDPPQLRGWPSAGFDEDVHGKKIPIGSRLLNATGSTIVAFRIKVNGTADTFKVDANSAGELFKNGTVWRRKDGTEAVFNGCNIPDNSYLWMLVYPQTPGFPAAYFSGEALTSDYQIPDPQNWDRIFPTTVAKIKPVMKTLIAACPNSLRDFRAFAESSDGKTVLFVSDNDLYVYEDRREEIHRVLEPVELPFGIDRITLEKKSGSENYVLWRKGHEVARVNLAKMTRGHLIGRVPKAKRVKR